MILSTTQYILSLQLFMHSPKIASAYIGAVHVLNAKDYADRLVQFAHSLRESIDLLARKNQNEDECKQPLSNRSTLLKRVLDPREERNDAFARLCVELHCYYRTLSDYAHHCHILTQPQAEQILEQVENILLKITKSQTMIDD